MSRLLTQLRKVENKSREAAAARAKESQSIEVSSGHLLKWKGPVPTGMEVARDFYMKGVESGGPWVFMFDCTVVERLTSDPRDFGVVYDARGLDVLRERGPFSDECQQGWEPPQGLPVLGRVGAGGGLIMDRCAFYGVDHWPSTPLEVERDRRKAGVGSQVKRAKR